jgi:hypothetical protein
MVVFTEASAGNFSNGHSVHIRKINFVLEKSIKGYSPDEFRKISLECTECPPEGPLNPASPMPDPAAANLNAALSYSLPKIIGRI